jgi:hypothetical protein
VNGRDFLVAGNQIGLYSLPSIVADIRSDAPWTLDELSKRIPAEVTKDLQNLFAPKEEAKS